jgi:hypothetical protein
MARLFASASTQFIEHNAALVTALPITMVGWVYPTTGVVSAVISVAKSADATGRWIYLNISATGRVAGWVRQDSGVDVQSASAGATHGTGAWFHAGAVFSGTSGVSTSIKAYADGTLQDTVTTTFTTPTSLDRTTIGRLSRTAPLHYQNGRLAHTAIWSVALSDAEILALSKGASPAQIQPASLVSYTPLWGLHSPEIDLVKNSATWTVTGATQANDAPVQSISDMLWTPHVGADVVASTGSHRGMLLGVGG